jgi:NAD(P)-dependent dehydrogenase (short-subunit alcohol dehydrogenase family)
VTRVALVTGASSGFGQATAALLAAQGFQVFATSRAPTHSAAGRFELFPLDVCSETSVQTCVQTILERTGHIDLLVNNAGFAQGGALEENSLEDARAQFEPNVFGVLRMLKAVLPVMRRQGSGQIITVSSLLGVVAMPYLSLYASSKFALEGMIEGLYHELRPFHIKVSLVEPGLPDREGSRIRREGTAGEGLKKAGALTLLLPFTIDHPMRGVVFICQIGSF